MLRRHCFKWLVFGLGFVIRLPAIAQTSQLFGMGAGSTMSRSAYHLHMGALWICIGIGIVTFVALFYSLVKFRRAKSHDKGRLGVEVLWAAMPTLILVLLAIPATKVLYVMHRDEQHHSGVVKALTKTELMKLGKASYVERCAFCHQVNGEGLKSVFPALKGSDIATGPVSSTVDIVLNGKLGTAMPAFRQQLDAETLASVITYVRNAWGNEAINKHKKQLLLVQPSGIVKAENQRIGR